MSIPSVASGVNLMNGQKDLLILKFGTSTLINKDGVLDYTAFELLAKQITRLHSNYRIVIVSSGAVAAGQGHINTYNTHHVRRKAAAAIGNHKLMQLFNEHFIRTDIVVAQILCDRTTFTDQKRFADLQETLTTLWHNNIVPIINENDVVSSQDLGFSDNDELATLFAVSFKSKQLLIGTSVAGLLNEGVVVQRIDNFTNETFRLVQDHTSSLGLGGMASKLRWAEHATKCGVEVIIFDARIAGNVLLANQRQTGTLCTAKQQKLAVTHANNMESRS